MSLLYKELELVRNGWNFTPERLEPMPGLGGKSRPEYSYRKVGDYYLPNLRLPADKERPIGVWGQRRLRYMKQHHRSWYFSLLTTGKLHSHLADIEEQSQCMFLRLVKQYADREEITEQLKAENPRAWVQKINSIRTRSIETVNTNLIYN